MLTLDVDHHRFHSPPPPSPPRLVFLIGLCVQKRQLDVVLVRSDKEKHSTFRLLRCTSRRDVTATVPASALNDF